VDTTRVIIDGPGAVSHAPADAAPGALDALLPRLAGAGVVGALLGAAVPPVNPVVRSALVLLAAILMGSLLQRSRHAAERCDRAAAMLTTAVGELLQTTGTAAIAEVGRRSAATLLEHHHDGDVAILLVAEGRLRLAGEPANRAWAGLPLADLPRSARTRLERGQRVAASGAALGFRGPAATQPRLVLPITGHGILQGVIVVTGSPSCAPTRGCPCPASLEVLAGQLSLALARDAVAREAEAIERRFHALVQRSADVIVVVGVDGIVRYRNPAFTAVLGHRAGTVAATHLAGIVHPDDKVRWAELLRHGDPPGGSTPLRCRLRHADGSWRDMEVHATDLQEEHGIACTALTLRDISDRTAVEADLTRQALHDALTGLPNRVLLMQRVKEALADPIRRDETALLFIDLDGFKDINDRLGHSSGDELLMIVAERLRNALRGVGCVARLAGDEFAVLIEDLPRLEQTVRAESIGERVLQVLDQPCTLQNEQVRVRASIGVAVGVTGLEDPGDLLHRADLAMYAAKAAGKGRCAVFDPAAHETMAAQRQLQSELHVALAQGQLQVRYQPLVSLADGRITSAEALVRWDHPQRGLLGPGTFISLAEDEGVIGEVFGLVLARACAQARAWQVAHGEAAPTVAVNLSPLQLHEPGLLEQVATALAHAALPPERLTLELTENVLVTDPQAAARVMSGLKAIGVRLAIDDFGTGYSSLAYLRALPLDILKVDKTFVDGLEGRDPSALLAGTIVDLGRRLGLQTVAEGVERPEQAALLRELGCDIAQGYLFARPMTGDLLSEQVAAQVGSNLTFV
jgi:diguanylate cyclase (GGDEF)-like protein/PAS domain S-box-containing protein